MKDLIKPVKDGTLYISLGLFAVSALIGCGKVQFDSSPSLKASQLPGATSTTPGGTTPGGTTPGGTTPGGTTPGGTTPGGTTPGGGPGPGPGPTGIAAKDTFMQSSSGGNKKVDILWVVDNSSSMTPLQTNLVNNFGSFINAFQQKGYDFQIGVTTTDAYLASSSFLNDPTRSLLKDGTDATSHTGLPILIPTVLNLAMDFVVNASQGAGGSGDERAFSSFKATLDNPLNKSFLRQNSFLAIVILSDEDDFSGDTRAEHIWQNSGVADHDYSAATLDTVDSYVGYLDNLTSSTPAHRNYNVSAIAVVDDACLQQHKIDSYSSIVGQRYMQLANATNGKLGSICEPSYGNSLNVIQNQIIQLVSQFRLTHMAKSNTVKVKVNSKDVAEDATNGWTYDSATSAIVFHGQSTPPEGSSIEVDYVHD